MQKTGLLRTRAPNIKTIRSEVKTEENSFIINYSWESFNFPVKNTVFSEKTTSQKSNPESLVYENNVQALIHINNESDIEKKRNNLINYIWKGKGSPISIPDEILTGISDVRFNDLTNLKRIDRFTINMEYGVDSKAYLFLADKSVNKLVIYNHGHDGGFYDAKNTIQFFLKNGYSVLAFSMPLKGMNSQPIGSSQSR